MAADEGKSTHKRRVFEPFITNIPEHHQPLDKRQLDPRLPAQRGTEANLRDLGDLELARPYPPHRVSIHCHEM